MREPTYFILLALHREPMHGYAITAQAKELSEGRVKLTAGTLYGALDRLEKQGLIEVDREEQVNGRRRRYYRITEAGEAATQAEAIRLRQTLEASLPFLGILPGGAAS